MAENMMQIYCCNEIGSNIRVELLQKQPWFVANDLCSALDINNSRQAITKLDKDEKRVSLLVTPGGKQSMNMVNESGMYNLIFQSRKPEAKIFRKWITSEVLPSIRQFGVYNLSQQTIGRRQTIKTSKTTLTEEMIELLQTIDSLLVKGDKQQIALECGISRHVLYAVLIGERRNAKVLSACYKKALENKKDINNILTNPQEALKKLKS